MNKLAIVLLILLSSFVGDKSRKVIDFSLKNMSENQVSLEDYRKEKGVILTFVTNNCPVSEKYQKRIAELQKNYQPKGFPVVAIDPVDSFEKMQKVSKERNYEYQFLCDATQEIAKKYDIHTNTHTLVLATTKRGFKIIYDGAIDDDYNGEEITKKYVEDAINQYLSKQKVLVPTTRPVGCTITYRE
jgi:peroxiredoxin